MRGQVGRRVAGESRVSGSMCHNAHGLESRAASLEKTLMLGGIQGRRRTAEDEMAGWHHRLDGREFE